MIIPPPNTKAIRELLNAIFADEDLDIFCYDYFPTVYEKFSASMSRKKKIHILIEYCDRDHKFDELLSLIHEINPVRYNEFTQEARQIASPEGQRRRSMDLNERGRSELRKWGEAANQYYWKWSNLGNAFEDFVSAIKTDPEYQDPWTNIAYTYYLIGKFEMAERCMSRSLGLSRPGEPGGNYKNVRSAIDNRLSMTERTIERPDEIPEWFKEKYSKYLGLEVDWFEALSGD